MTYVELRRDFVCADVDDEPEMDTGLGDLVPAADVLELVGAYRRELVPEPAPAPWPCHDSGAGVGGTRGSLPRPDLRCPWGE